MGVRTPRGHMQNEQPAIQLALPQHHHSEHSSLTTYQERGQASNTDELHGCELVPQDTSYTR